MSYSSSEAEASRGSWFTRFPARFRRKISQGAYRPEIDGLRFFAIAFVVFGHGLERAQRFFPSYQRALGGSTLESFLQVAPPGVFLFFAVSGFILAGQAIRSGADPLSAKFLKSYFGRRLLRIEPPYIVLLVATWAVLGLTHWTPEGVHRFDVEPRSLNVSLIASLFYLHDLVWGTFPRLFPPGWSLEVEVQFYILAPLLFAVWASLPRRSDRLALTALFLFSGINLTLLGWPTLGPLHVEYSLMRYFNYFFVGIALAYFREPLAAGLARRSGSAATWLGWGGLAVFIAAGAPGEREVAGVEAARLIAVYAGLAAVFASTFDARSGFRAFCASPWISLIGGACYSLYLVHLQIVQMVFVVAAKAAPALPLVGVAALFAISAMAVTVVGLVYYIQIERRFMARDWPQATGAFLRARLSRRTPAQSALQRAFENAASSAAPREATMPRDRSLQQRSAATRP